MCWKIEYVLLILTSTGIDFFAGLRMGSLNDKAKRKKYLILSFIANLGLLFGFKYFNFVNESLRTFFNCFNIFYDIPAFNVLLPVGISFYTFQTLSYSIDVYRGIQKPERHLGRFAVYVAFFPQLVAGPIERSTRLLPQFQEQSEWSYRRATEGLKLMLWGFFKKLVIADRLALFIDPVYNNPEQYTGINFIVATLFFAFQIYCDFSGYSDIAIGSARILGFRLMNNFNRPYLATSISEFWRRWHISLSTWFRDYLYIPLGGNRVKRIRLIINLMIVFIISGMWHGANWTFIVWGGLHGFYLILGILTKSYKERLKTIFRIKADSPLARISAVFITFSLTCLAWIFFRSNNLQDALYIFTHLFEGVAPWALNAIHGNINLDILTLASVGELKYEFMIAILAIVSMEIIHLIQRDRSIQYLMQGFPIAIRWCFYFGAIYSILILGNFNLKQFIYFQF